MLLKIIWAHCSKLVAMPRYWLEINGVHPAPLSVGKQHELAWMGVDLYEIPSRRGTQRRIDEIV
jgi:hypothetical protein